MGACITNGGRYYRSIVLKRDIAGYGKQYPTIRWPNNSRIAVSIVVHYEEGAERSPLEGDAHPEFGNQPVAGTETRRNLSTESAYEYGSRRGFWRILETLHKNEVKATFFCSGQALEKNPIAAQEITANGHEACAHGYRWLPSYEFSREEEKPKLERPLRRLNAQPTNVQWVGTAAHQAPTLASFLRKTAHSSTIRIPTEMICPTLSN